MRYIITTSTAVALIAGIALGFVVSRGLEGSASAAPPPPAETKVREQNLDGSGLIRVHEQGTAAVNVTNASLPVTGAVDVGNLPAVQDVNVVSMPSQTGRLVNLSLTPSGSGNYRSQMVDVADCSRITILVHGGSLDPYQYASADGTTAVRAFLEGTVAGGSDDGIQSASLQSREVVTLPFFQAKVLGGGVGAPTPTAWLWCAP